MPCVHVSLQDCCVLSTACCSCSVLWQSMMCWSFESLSTSLRAWHTPCAQRRVAYQILSMHLAMRSLCCTAVSGGKLRKRSAASAASWEDEDLVQDAGDALDLTEDDANVSTVSSTSH